MTTTTKTSRKKNAKARTYYQRPDGLFEASRRIDGKRVVFRARTCEEVSAKIEEYRQRLENERLYGREFPEIADEWMAEQERRLSQSTRNGYGIALRRLKAAFPGYASQIRVWDIKKHIGELELQGYSAGYVQMELSVCRMILKHAVNTGDIETNPAREVEKSKGLPAGKREALTEEQEHLVKESGKKQTAHWWLFGYLLFYTGCRRGEALALEWEDIDWDARVIHINKKINYASGLPVLEDWLKSQNGKRDIPLLKPLAEVLVQSKDRTGLIFPSETAGGHMNSYELGKHWRQYCRDIGLNKLVTDSKGQVTEQFPITPHCFRHSFATLCYEAGLDARAAACFLGDTPEMLERVYTHLRDVHRAEAAAKLSAYVEG